MDKLHKDILKIVERSFNLTDKEHRKVLQLYNNTKNNINRFIAELYTRFAVDGLLDYDDYLVNHARDTEQYILEETERIATFEAVQLAVILELVFNDTYSKSTDRIGRAINITTGINFNLLRPNQIEAILNYNWSGIPFSERIWYNREHLVRTLRQELARGLQAGESLDKIARRINKRFNSKAYESQRLIRTESARVINEATEQAYRKAGVKEVQFLATLDNRTSDICQSLNGKIFRLDDKDKPVLPQHPNCRSVYLPIINI